MVPIQNGNFQMGSPVTEPDRFDDETQHVVTLTQGFRMGKYPVMQAEYEAVMGTNPSWYKTTPVPPETSTAKRPVEHVNWYDAIVFCNKLSMLEGLSPAYRIPGFSNSTDPADWGDVPAASSSPNKATWDAVQVVNDSTGYRLPTEAQWEYACRAGTTTGFSWGSNYIDNTKANFYSITVDVCNPVAAPRLSPPVTWVGSYAPNPWGLYDMHGNVNEWCWDWYLLSYGSTAAVDPAGPATGTNRVERGGGWSASGANVRTAYRRSSSPASMSSATGMRLVRPLTDSR
jgi:formylglycine-generating enzyme required for sulfatase activity